MRRRRSAALALVALLALAGHAAAAPLTVGFYLPWDAASRASLVAHAGSLTVVSPVSASVDTAQGHVRWQPDQALPGALAAARRKPKVYPTISNAHDQVWDVTAAEAVLADTAASQAVIDDLVVKAAAQGYGGYVLDFENLSPKGWTTYPPFLARLRAALKPSGREVWVTATMSADGELVRALGQSTDAVVLMAYDQCWATSTPGPIASPNWISGALAERRLELSPGKIVVALGAYGYDWPLGGAAAVVSATQAEALAQVNHAEVIRSAPDGNPHFSYIGGDGRPHQVWWLDAAAVRSQAARIYRVHGMAIWRLGLEDPALWTGPGLGPDPSAALTAAAPRPPCAPLPAAPPSPH
ncbi:glycosyl hydrolase family 18 protein [Phenylobacterium sp.]|uniref:glycosyl hydrolase family 18 protein n=1 Tax=Phenylobacterium sp. TaxID=1871053 RepID=UPI0011FCBCAF|nr:glycosyl hydrolase family 18 protein [Phenylobacterium sp.]THD61546.1 MAG: hypothetical protein E8A49_11245 [Phenylobacterium sp.]